MNCKTISSGKKILKAVATIGLSYLAGVASDHFVKFPKSDNNKYAFYSDEQENAYDIKLLDKKFNETDLEHINRLQKLYDEHELKILTEKESDKMTISIIKRRQKDHAAYSALIEATYDAALVAYADSNDIFEDEQVSVQSAKEAKDAKDAQEAKNRSIAVKERLKLRKSSVTTQSADTGKSGVRTNITPENIGVTPEEPKTSDPADPSVIVKD